MFLYLAGSNFFDLQSDNSDIDFRGVYLPSPEKFHKEKDLFKVIPFKTNKNGTKNSNVDVDLSLVPLPFFFELLRKGDFNMMESLFTLENKIILMTPLMEEIIKQRDNLILRNIKTFIGFFNKEYIKYTSNVFHHKHRVDFVKFLESLSLDQGIRLQDHWSLIIEYSKDKKNGLDIIKTKTDKFTEHPSIDIGFRKFQWRAKISYVIKELNKFIKVAGNRQKNIVENGQDLKGLYHCLRLLYEGEDILKKGELLFPFNKERYDLLLKIKNNKITEKEAVKIVEKQLKKVRALEEKVLSNQEDLNYRIDKIQNNLMGRMKLKYILEENK